ncbi:trans-aconitate 2-methyltransferase [Kibdelosporangium persicum]|uniref:Demethylrebeccamycin-D-glucose O-methyltransferase n=1 Tax=Kibdelosporangium persicum TaxID=2698649 RepID=A0ABX2F8S1_9PSEU|nr:class I SAM-dependent methyltransferase [Kibdelosporangium persicum]NRN67321.1 Demethylrebeccamycin-D-glucose O-methyltransferase [Kibdelosporangium persicum]
MGVHTHDDFDWTTRLVDLRRRDSIAAEAYRGTADRLVGMLQPGSTVVDIGSGAGGMAAQLGLALRARGGGRLVLVDAVQELLDAATEHVRTVLSGPGATVTVDTVLGDAASDELANQLPAADLVWAAAVVHHLRDQQEGVNRLAGLLASGGWLALAEDGLGTQCLPWDLGVGAPGLTDRLIAARKAWFAQMRADIPGSVRLTVGWTRSLADAGLRDVTSFSYLIDHPAPVSEEVRTAVIGWLHHTAEVVTDLLAEDDRTALARLLDPADPAFVGARDDLFYLASTTVNLGRRG